MATTTMFTAQDRRFPWWWIWAGVGAALALFLVATLSPIFDLYLWYGSFRISLQDEFHLSAAHSTLIAAVLGFLFAFVVVPALFYTTATALLSRKPKRLIPMFAAWIIFVGTTPVLHAFFGTDPCFNRATGEPLKWYVKGIGGALVFYDNDGLDPSGVQKRPVTPAICRIDELQKAGIFPDEITDDPRTVRYFDPSTGDPVVWYSRTQDGLRIFDAEGFDPKSGELLLPVNADLVFEAHTFADNRENAARVEAAARGREAAHMKLIAEFGAANYADGVVIVGAQALGDNQSSKLAAQQVLRVLTQGLRGRGIVVDEFAPAFYESRHFNDLINGDAANLIKVGLAERIRGVIITEVEARCQESETVPGVISCSIALRVRAFSSGGRSTSVYHIDETGAGATIAQALSHAALLVSEHHSEILAEV